MHVETSLPGVLFPFCSVPWRGFQVSCRRGSAACVKLCLALGLSWWLFPGLSCAVFHCSSAPAAHAPSQLVQQWGGSSSGHFLWPVMGCLLRVCQHWELASLHMPKGETRSGAIGRPGANLGCLLSLFSSRTEEWVYKLMGLSVAKLIGFVLEGGLQGSLNILMCRCTVFR